MILRSKFDSRRDTCNKEKEEIFQSDFNPETGGGGGFYTGAVFPPGGNSILTLKIGGDYMLGRFFPPWGKFYPGPVFPGGRTMRGESLCYNTGLIQRTAPFSRLLRHTRGCGGSILPRILTCPLSVAFYDTQGDVEDLF